MRALCYDRDGKCSGSPSRKDHIMFGLSDLTSRYSIVDLDTGTVLGTNIAIVPSRFITENELSNDSAAISAAKEYGYVLYANLDERITSWHALSPLPFSSSRYSLWAALQYLRSQWATPIPIMRCWDPGPVHRSVLAYAPRPSRSQPSRAERINRNHTVT